MVFIRFVLILAYLFPAAAASPPASITLGASTFESDFPNGMIATLQVTPQEQVQQARLFVTMDGAIYNSQDATIPQHEPGETITLEVRWNGLSLTRDPSPPWVPLQFWWELFDTAGNQVNTTPQQHVYSDRRRSWSAAEGTHVSVYTYSQSANLINQAVAIGDQAVARLQNVFGHSLPYRPALIFYNSAADGDSDMGTSRGVPFGTYVVGRAYPGTSGVVMLARSDSAYLQRTITHEVAHLFQYQLGPMLFDAPHWWIEGDARAQEPAASITRSLDYAKTVALRGELPDLATWDSRNYNSEASLDHALYLGASFVIYLREIYGAQAHANFYQTWRQNRDFYATFEATFGRNLAELDHGWRAWLLGNNAITANADVEIVPNIPTAVPEVPPGMARVNAYWLNFRSSPSLESDVLALLSIGQLLLPIGRDESGEWLLVELPDGMQGWLSAEFVDYNESIEALTISLY